MKKPLLRVENLNKRFVSTRGMFSSKKICVQAVNNVSFELNQGEILGLVGESGCGKSTTGKTLLNLLKPDGGRVLFDDQLVFDVEKNKHVSKKEMIKIRREMQIIFQDPYACLDPRRTINDIVSEGLKLDKAISKSEREKKVKNIIEKCGLSVDCLVKYPHQFSGGQRQRIGIARALSVEPKFVVCDEPTAALDVSIQSQILNLMTDLKEDMNLSYLFISHDLTIIENFCDKICVMYLGSIVEQSSAKELFKKPYHPYTKALISAVPRFGKENHFEDSMIEGEIPSPTNVPKGCPFHTRCPKKMSICEKQKPVLSSVDAQHDVACHLFNNQQITTALGC